MKRIIAYFIMGILMIAGISFSTPVPEEEFKSFSPPVSFNTADKRAEEILSKLSIEEKIDLIGGQNLFFIQGLKKFNIPSSCQIGLMASF